MLCQELGCGKGILILYGDDLIVYGCIQYLRYEACADTLDLVRAALSCGKYRRCGRLYSYDLDVRILLF